ncbi:hypothetical protein V1264_023576 [Littorina saxatilis]|uniref:Sterol carrier protein 2 n=1 Tax=Littorina saxatilis TaxID=31220 RepID=A0AAN9B8E7_9CAEN
MSMGDRTQPAQRAFVVGVGMTKFERPKSKDWDYPDMAREAGQAALKDAGLQYRDIKVAVASYCYGEPTSGQRAVYELGLTGIPVFNVNNNCSSGSTGLMMARRFVQSGVDDCVLAIGFEKMEGGLSERYTDRISPVGRHMDHMVAMGADPGLIQPRMNHMTSDVIKMFAYAAREYMDLYPEKAPDVKSIATKAVLCHPITFGMTAATADGSAAAIVCSEAFVKRHGLENKAVEILAQHMVTDLPSSFGKSFRDLCGYSMAKKAAQRCYFETGLTSNDVQVFEVHDCFSCNELFMYEALQCAPEGHGLDLMKQSSWRQNKQGGELLYFNNKWVFNPSGGLESKGHPIGATGLGQCAELVWQLRGEAGKRQVEGAKVAMQHNFGIGGAAVVTMYKKYQPSAPQARL